MGPGGNAGVPPVRAEDLHAGDLEAYLHHLQQGVNGDIQLNEAEQAQLQHLQQAANNTGQMNEREREQWERLVQEHGDEGKLWHHHSSSSGLTAVLTCGCTDRCNIRRHV